MKIDICRRTTDFAEDVHALSFIDKVWLGIGTANIHYYDRVQRQALAGIIFF